MNKLCPPAAACRCCCNPQKLGLAVNEVHAVTLDALRGLDNKYAGRMQEFRNQVRPQLKRTELQDSTVLSCCLCPYRHVCVYTNHGSGP